MKKIILLLGLAFTLILTGCAGPQPYNYAAFKQSKPASILVLTPTNQSPDVDAPYSLVSQVAYPLAEAGYYVLPVAVVAETFKQNGLTNGNDIQAVSPKKLYEIFGADAVLYLNIEEYGSSYMVVSSETRVTAAAKLVDLRSGQLLWSGRATASSNEQNSGNNGLIGMLVNAVVTQIMDTVTERDHSIAGIASVRLLSAGQSNGILYGPRSPHYGMDAP